VLSQVTYHFRQIGQTVACRCVIFSAGKCLLYQ